MDYIMGISNVAPLQKRCNAIAKIPDRADIALMKYIQNHPWIVQFLILARKATLL